MENELKVDKCKNCGNELHHVEGRRKKKFCSPKCKIAHWNKNSGKKEKKYVRIETYNELALQLEKLTKEKSEGTALQEVTVEDKIVVLTDSVNQISETVKPDTDKDAIVAQIKAIRAEKIPSHRDTPIGKKVWAADQRKRVEVLEKELSKITD